MGAKRGEIGQRTDLPDLFTLVVLTHNRYLYLERLLEYYSVCGFPFRIVVLDSSMDTLESERLKTLLTSPRVTHRRFSTDIAPVKKLAMGLSDITTPYCAVGAEDDFSVTKGIAECVAFLEETSDYSIAQGFFIQHTIKRDRKGRPHYFWWPLYESQTSVVFDMPEDRLRFAWNGFNGGIFHAVFRTPLLRLIWAEAAEKATNYCLYEHLPFILGLMYSKVSILNVFFSSREKHATSWIDKASKRKFYLPEECAPVIDCWAGHLARLQSMDYAEARKIVKENLDLYLSRIFGETLQGGRSFESKEVTVSNKDAICSGFIGHILRKVIRRCNKYYYWCVLKIRFNDDFSRIGKLVTATDIDPELLSRTRQSYSKNCKG